jgi:hypothetical protein
MSINMGLGNLGLPRKARWYFEAEFPAGKIEKQRIRCNKYFENKRFSTTFFDLDEKDILYKIIFSFYDINDSSQEEPFSPELINNMMGTAVLTLANPDNPDEILERYSFQGVFPKSINWGCLSFEATEQPETEVVWQFKECQPEV